MPQPSEYEKRLNELEVSIDRLRNLYEQYFRGLEKMPPTVLQKKVEREMREMRKVRHRNTAVRFRLQMQVQKYTTYLTYWQRILRDIEHGKLKRSPAGLTATRGGGVPPRPAPPRPANLDIPEPPARPAPSSASSRPDGEDELLDIDIEIDF